jgi:uncharacterized cupredoxin-like copper-binding protein
MSRFQVRLGVVTVGALLIAGCASEDSGEATTQLEITGTDDLAFEPDSFTVPAGEEVTVELSSGEAVDHDLVIEGAAEHGMAGDDGHGEHDDEAHAMDTGDLHVAHADPGETVTSTFVLEEPGTYEVYCSVPGHRESGMISELTVVDDQ